MSKSPIKSESHSHIFEKEIPYLEYDYESINYPYQQVNYCTRDRIDSDELIIENSKVFSQYSFANNFSLTDNFNAKRKKTKLKDVKLMEIKKQKKKIKFPEFKVSLTEIRQTERSGKSPQ